MKRIVYLTVIVLMSVVVSVSMQSCKGKKGVHRSGGKSSSGKMY
jgi:hypothetical protein